MGRSVKLVGQQQPRGQSHLSIMFHMANYIDVTLCDKLKGCPVIIFPLLAEGALMSHAALCI